MKPLFSSEGPFKVGDRLGNLEIQGLLGKGGHAFVYDGFDPFLAKHVAVKVIPNPVHRGRDLTRRAREEARVLDRIDHPNVVRVSVAGYLPDGMVYIVMERLHGRPLREILLRLGCLSVPEALHVAWQIAEGVAAAHALGVIHRDLKPENVVVQPGNRVKILDFGIAKLLDRGIDTTQKEVFHGTLLYMSPEQLQGYGVTFRSDIYALGTILYELIAGKNPCLIDVPEPTMESLAWIQMARVPPRLERLVRAVPDYVALLVRRATAKQAAQRFSDMQEFADALRSALARFLRDTPPKQAAMRDLVEASGGIDREPSVPASGVLPRESPGNQPMVGPSDTEPSPAPGASTESADVDSPREPPAAAQLLPSTTLPAVPPMALAHPPIDSHEAGSGPAAAPTRTAEVTPARPRRRRTAARRRIPVFLAVAVGLGVGATVGIVGEFAKHPAAASAGGMQATLVAALTHSRAEVSPPAISASVAVPSEVAGEVPTTERVAPSATRSGELLALAAEADVGAEPPSGAVADRPPSPRRVAPGASKPEAERTSRSQTASDAERMRRRALLFEQETGLAPAGPSRRGRPTETRP
jgi:serine/threonine-protein kinase